MTTKIVASLLFTALCVLGSGARAAAASPPAALAPNTGANTGTLDLTSPGGFFGPPPPPASSTTPPAASGPALSSPFPPPYHSQIPNVPATRPVRPGTDKTPNIPGTVGGTGTALPPAP